MLPTIFDSHQKLHRTQLYFSEQGVLAMFFSNYLCFKSCFRSVLFSCNFFCASNCAPDGSFLVQLFALQIVLQMGLFACIFLGEVRSLENISWFHFAWCSPSVIACNDCKSKYFFSQAALFSSWLNKQKKVCCTCCIYISYFC